MNQIKHGDAVAVLPLESESPSEAMSIATVDQVEDNGLRLVDGRFYRLVKGKLIGDDQTWITRATVSHFEAVHRRCGIKPLSRVR